MRSKTGLGAYVYPAAAAAHPHAPNIVGGASYAYDANSKMTTGLGGELRTYDAENRVKTAQLGGVKMTYVYGADGARLKNGGAGSTTLTIGPIELRPVLVASTFPLDVVKAGRFVEGAADLSDKDRAAKAVGQTRDDSVRELAAGFPDLVTRMSDNIDWTEQAGEAVVAQTGDVLASIQRLRAKAKENGCLVDNEAQKIEEVKGKIVIAPATPGTVYVPACDSKVV